MKRPLLLLTVVLFAAALVACSPSPAQPTSAPTVQPTNAPAPTSEAIRLIEPPARVRAFSLTSQADAPIALTDFAGKYAMFTFGYLNCPDVCPVTLANFTNIKRELGAEAEGVQFVFVSVDGERDTPAALLKHLANFDSTFIGITGTAQDVMPLTQDFGVRYKREKPEGTASAYLVTHTASSFLLNPEGQLIRIYSYGTDAEVIAADVAKLLKP
jgi:protein SCO1